MITRRKWMLTMAGVAGAAITGANRAIFGQGISSRGVKAQPRGKPSGRPFYSHLTDVAKQAGLIHPVLYGGVDSKNYIIELVRRGVALVNYYNDGGVDLLGLSETRLDG